MSVIASREKGALERVVIFEPLHAPGIMGFHLLLQDGGEAWYQKAGTVARSLHCGPGSATATGLLVVRQGKELSGLALGASDLQLNGQAVASTGYYFEFTNAGVRAPILRPIDPVSFRPNRNIFDNAESVEMVSQTPEVEIRYTTDGTPPTRRSTLYHGPIKITASTTFAACAYRPGTADEFEIDGTHFTEPTWGWFTKAPAHPAAVVASASLEPGLQYDTLNAPWWRLYSEAHWLPAEKHGVAAREMDLAGVTATEPYGRRYHGFLKIPEDGLYTFHAPPELVSMGTATSYDLRVYVDDEEWYLTQWWHGHGTWTVPLKAGLHKFQVDFADARSTPWRKSGMWRYYPRPWAVFQSPPSPILLSGPRGEEPTRIPPEWLFRERGGEMSAVLFWIEREARMMRIESVILSSFCDACTRGWHQR